MNAKWLFVFLTVCALTSARPTTEQIEEEQSAWTSIAFSWLSGRLKMLIGSNYIFRRLAHIREWI